MACRTGRSLRAVRRSLLPRLSRTCFAQRSQPPSEHALQRAPTWAGQHEPGEPCLIACGSAVLLSLPRNANRLLLDRSRNLWCALLCQRRFCSGRCRRGCLYRQCFSTCRREWWVTRSRRCHVVAGRRAARLILQLSCLCKQKPFQWICISDRVQKQGAGRRLACRHTTRL